MTCVLHCALSRVDTSTKGLLEHLSRAHGIAAIGDQGYLVGKPSLQTRWADGTAIAQFASWKRSSKEYKRNRDLLVAWVASGLRPFTIVKDKEFHTLLNSLEPRFPVPGRVTVARRAAELHM